MVPDDVALASFWDIRWEFCCTYCTAPRDHRQFLGSRVATVLGPVLIAWEQNRVALTAP